MPIPVPISSTAVVVSVVHKWSIKLLRTDAGKNMAFADISLEEALVLEAYEEDILDEEETLLAFELLNKSKGIPSNL